MSVTKLDDLELDGFRTAAALKQAKKDFHSDFHSSMMFWDSLGRLVGEPTPPGVAPFSMADKRLVFWNAHSRFGKMLLRKQHPAFDPDSDVWKTNEERATEDLLTRVKHFQIFGYIVRMFAMLRYESFFTSFYIWCVYFACLLPFYTKGAIEPIHVKITLFAVIPLDATAICIALLSEAVLRVAEYARGILTSDPAWASTKSGPSWGIYTELGRFVDAGRQELIVKKFRAGKLTDSEFWLKLDALVDRRVISRAERRQLFWDFNDRNRKKLVKTWPVFSPQHAFWTSQDERAIVETDKALSHWLLLDAQRRKGRRPYVLENWFSASAAQRILVLGTYSSLYLAGGMIANDPIFRIQWTMGVASLVLDAGYALRFKAAMVKVQLQLMSASVNL